MAIRDMVRRGAGLPVRRRRGESAHPLLALRDEMNRIFDSFWEEGFLGPWLGERMPELWGLGPRVDVREDRESVEVIAELPGVTEKDVEVSLAPTRDLLTIRGQKREEREEKAQDYYCAERSFGAFHRDIPLPAEVKEEDIEAKFKDGLLTVKMAKTGEKESRRRKIPVKTG